MFRRKDQLVVTQVEHSRLSGELAALIGSSVGFEDKRLFGAIALHDWPHFADPQVADTIEIGTKTDQEQLELLERLEQEMPLDDFTELIVRMHWRRLSNSEDLAFQEAIDAGRIERLIEAAHLTRATAARLDGWTGFADALSFYLSRSEVAEGKVVLETTGDSWRLDWKTGPDELLISGVSKPFRGAVSLLAYDAGGYPEVLAPVMLEISCAFDA